MPKLFDGKPKHIQVKPRAHEQYYVYLPLNMDDYLLVDHSEDKKEERPLLEPSEPTNQPRLIQMFVVNGVIGTFSSINQETNNPRFLQVYSTEDEAINAALKKFPDQQITILSLKIPTSAIVADRIKLDYAYIQTIASYNDAGGLEREQKIHGARTRTP